MKKMVCDDGGCRGSKVENDKGFLMFLLNVMKNKKFFYVFD